MGVDCNKISFGLSSDSVETSAPGPSDASVEHENLLAIVDALREDERVISWMVSSLSRLSFPSAFFLCLVTNVPAVIEWECCGGRAYDRVALLWSPLSLAPFFLWNCFFKITIDGVG